jgi:hypothetical protein
MTSARDRDLERWEEGELSMADLVALHGSDGAAGLVVLHRRMSALGKSPVGDPEAAWRAIRERLPDLAGHRRTVPLRRRLTRPLAIAAAAALIAGTAYAGSTDAVQRYVTSFWRTVQSILDVDLAGSAPADADRPSQSGGLGDGPAGAVDDAGLEDRDDDEANEGDEGLGETTEGNDHADGDDVEGDDENGSDDDEGVGGGDEGDDDGDEPNDDEADEGDESDDDEPDDEDDAPEDDGEDPEDDAPDGSGGGDDEGD